MSPRAVDKRARPGNEAGPEPAVGPAPSLESLGLPLELLPTAGPSDSVTGLTETEPV